MKKVKIPEGMKKAAGSAIKDIDPKCFLVYPALEAALLWLSDNPIVPTHSQVQDIASSNVYHTHDIAKWIEEWQRRMFLDPEPEPELKDLLFDANPFPNTGAKHRHDESVREAYRRGKEAK
jgi:hypothetical protein